MCLCVPFYLCICNIYPCRCKHSTLVFMCVPAHTSVCVCVCHNQRQWWEVRGQMQPAFQTPGICFDNNSPPSFCPTQASSPDSSKRRDHRAWHRPTDMHTNTHTHLLELQLYTTSQSNTSLLSKQHQNTPITFYLRAEGFQVITHPPAAILEVLSSWETVTVKG